MLDFNNLKQVFLQVLIGCLVSAAAIAVLAVLIGEFNEILAKALFTILVVAGHSLATFGFVFNRQQNDSSSDLSFFTNSLFVIIIFSFITSLFGLWELIPGELVGKLYLMYFVFLFATLHGEVLAKTLHNDRKIDSIVYWNYGFMLLVVGLLLPVIFFADTADFGEVYYRVLAAAGIIDATLTLVAIIMHKLYLQKHPKIESPVFGAVQQSQQKKSGWHILVWLLVGYIALQFIASLAIGILSAFN